MVLGAVRNLNWLPSRFLTTAKLSELVMARPRLHNRLSPAKDTLDAWPPFLLVIRIL